MTLCNSLRHKWRKWQRLTVTERSLFLQATWMLPLVTIALRALSFRNTRALLARLGSSPRTRVADKGERMEDLSRASYLVSLAAKHAIIPATCLPRALTLWWLLNRRGVEVELRVGMRISVGRLESHAWIESEGLPLNDWTEVRNDFTPFPQSFTPRR
jgi:Transglutaminase-like superfamily